MPTKSEAKDRITRALEQIRELMDLNVQSEKFITWKRSTEIAISNTFGNDATHTQEFASIEFTPRIGTPGPATSTSRNSYRNGLARARAILQSMFDEIEEYWPDDSTAQPIAAFQETPAQQVSNRVFVVHGRDDGLKETVARFLEHLDLEAIILHEQPNQSRTIIDKFEKYSQVDFAVILCTPDDLGKLNSEGEELRPRPRQNVVLEWGFFLGMLGRERVCALLKGHVEIPSDYDGVLYIQMEGSDDWRTKLAIELKSAGMPVDLNLLASA